MPNIIENKEKTTSTNEVRGIISTIKTRQKIKKVDTLK